MGVDRLLFEAPKEERIHVDRAPVEATCDECGSTSVATYPVADSFGPRIVVKCQDCFYCLEVRRPRPDEPWPPWRSATADWPASRLG